MNSISLCDMKVGSSALVTKVEGEGALRQHLLDMGLIPRTAVTLKKIAPMGDPLELRVRGYELTLRREDAARIEVEVREG